MNILPDQGHGINITFNETSVDNKTRIAKHQKTEVWWSNINHNEGTGMRVGNYCRYAFIYLSLVIVQIINYSLNALKFNHLVSGDIAVGLTVRLSYLQKQLA